MNLMKRTSYLFCFLKNPLVYKSKTLNLNLKFNPNAKQFYVQNFITTFACIFSSQKILSKTYINQLKIGKHYIYIDYLNDLLLPRNNIKILYAFSIIPIQKAVNFFQTKTDTINLTISSINIIINANLTPFVYTLIKTSFTHVHEQKPLIIIK